MTNIENIRPVGSFNRFYIGDFMAVADLVGASANANTGIAFDRARRRIYISSVQANIKMFSEDYRYLGEWPCSPSQGIAYDSVNDTIIGFTGKTTLITYNINGIALNIQTITLFGVNPGTACYNENEDCLYLATTGTNIRRLIRGTGYDWVVDTDIPTANYFDGIGYDPNTKTIYYHTTTNKIRHIQMDGTTIRELNRTQIIGSNMESVAFNPFRNTLYCNYPGYYHGGQFNMNRCYELYPNYYAW